MRIKIKTYGCTSNQSDSEIIRGLLKQEGHEIVNENPEVTIINTCIVKTPTENKILKELRKLKKEGRKAVIAGCMAQVMKHELISEFPGWSIIGVEEINKIPEAIKKVIQSTSRVNPEKPVLPRERNNNIIEILNVCKGCLGCCTYCSAKLARGDLKSYSQKSILDQARKALIQGVKELWITAQDTGSYGIDIKTSLNNLINEILKFENDFMIRIGMMNPDSALRMLPELISILKHPKVFKFVHLPVQAGNDRILKLMNRNYSVNDFKKMIKELKKSIPKITIATDVICGFPTETDSEFNDSLELIKEVRPDVLNISRYWPRKGTEAYGMRDHHGRITKRRSRLMTELFNKISSEKNKEWISWEGRVLIDEKGQGRNDYYKPVVIKGDLGEKKKIRIIKAGVHYLVGWEKD